MSAHGRTNLRAPASMSSLSSRYSPNLDQGRTSESWCFSKLRGKSDLSAIIPNTSLGMWSSFAVLPWAFTMPLQLSWHSMAVWNLFGFPAAVQGQFPLPHLCIGISHGPFSYVAIVRPCVESVWIIRPVCGL
jgi:hypothetical protein